jgi:hypothetical protein
MADSRPESRSWAELVQTIDHERKNLPWDPTKTQPVQRVGMYEVGIVLLLRIHAPLMLAYAYLIYSSLFKTEEESRAGV